MSGFFERLGDGTKILAYITALLAGVVVVFALSDVPPPDEPGSLALPSASPVTPGKENVSHDFLVEQKALQQALEEAPNDTTVLFRLAWLLQDAHRADEAAIYYRRYLDLHPANRQAWLDLANCYAELQQWPLAQEATEALLSRDPDDPSALYNMGAILANRGEVERAETWWQKVRMQDTDPGLAAMAEVSLERLTSAGS